MHNFHDKLIEVRDRVQRAALNADRDPNEIKILAVSKTQTSERIREAFVAGQSCFGENYLQEALDKQQALAELNIEWHFIGPIQSNKTRPIAESFAWVHSIDRLKIAQRLSKQRPDRIPALKVCLQINIDNEDRKGGVGEASIAELAKACSNLPRLELTGLMAIPLPRTGYQQQVAAFQRVRAIRDALEQTLAIPLPTLSMGMSGDLEAAIEAGANMIRIGTDLFGPRLTANG